jgi:adenosine deaminase
MSLETFIRRMPKVELHVHLEGSIRPETLLTLAARNGVALPAQSVAGLRQWYQFSDFAHFIDVYLTICACLRTPTDFELIAWEFLQFQAEQNIRYSEVTFTPYTHHAHVPFEAQLAAISRARARAEAELGVTLRLVPDIARNVRPFEHSLQVADWAIAHQRDGIVALGLGGPEVGYPPELFRAAFGRAHAAGLPAVPHAGETEGPVSIRGAIEALRAVRIGHGVRCLEDPGLVTLLRARQIPLEVCPSSNVCLGVAADLRSHPLPRLMEAGLYVTINSDDPPMFDTTLTDEYLRIAQTFQFDLGTIQQWVINGVRASLLPAAARQAMEAEFRAEFASLQAELDSMGE